MKYLSILLIFLSGCVTVKPKPAPDKSPGPLIPFVFKEENINKSFIDRQNFPITIRVDVTPNNDGVYTKNQLFEKAKFVFNNSFSTKRTLNLKVTLIILSDNYAFFEFDCLN